jgi:hypothetical protein
MPNSWRQRRKMASPLYVYLDNVRIFFDRYTLPFVLILGNVTNVANVYLFSRRNLRVYACSWYFICLSIAHLLLLDTLCVSRIIMAWTNDDYATYSPAYCKIRSYLFSLAMVLSRQFICLISIDRWLVTSSRAWLRNQSSLRTSRYLIIGSVLFWSIYDAHALIGYQANRFGCYPPSGTIYSLFASVDTIVTTLVPSVSQSSWFWKNNCVCLIDDHDHLQSSCIVQPSFSRCPSDLTANNAGLWARTTEIKAQYATHPLVSSSSWCIHHPQLWMDNIRFLCSGEKSGDFRLFQSNTDEFLLEWNWSLFAFYIWISMYWRFIVCYQEKGTISL